MGTRARGGGVSVSEELGRAGKSWEDSDKFCSSPREEATFVEAMEGKTKKIKIKRNIRIVPFVLQNLWRRRGRIE